MYKLNLPRVNTAGFTIIEVIIVLAIAGLIVVMVLLVVPPGQKSARDHGRRAFAGYVGGQINSYRQDHNLLYPSADAEKCDFMRNYLPEYVSANAACIYDSARDCMVVSGYRYDVCFHSAATSSHGYLGDVNELSIQTGHWCNTSPAQDNEDPLYPITAGPSGDSSLQVYAVWMALEKVRLVCVSSR